MSDVKLLCLVDKTSKQACEGLSWGLTTEGSVCDDAVMYDRNLLIEYLSQLLSILDSCTSQIIENRDIPTPHEDQSSLFERRIEPNHNMKLCIFPAQQHNKTSRTHLEDQPYERHEPDGPKNPKNRALNGPISRARNRVVVPCARVLILRKLIHSQLASRE